MTLLAQADAKYRAAGSLNLDRIPVHDPAVSECWAAATAFLRRINVRDRPAVWAAACNAVTALRWSLLTRPRHGVSTEAFAGTSLDRLLSEAQNLVGRADSAILGSLHQVLAASDALGLTADELAEQVAASAADGPADETCVVLVGTSARQVTESAISDRLPGVRFLVPRQFLGGRLWNRAVVVGISEWFPAELFTAPRCRELTLVHHRWLRDRRQIDGLFAVAGDGSFRVVLPTQNEARIGREMVLPPTKSIDWSGIEPVGGKPVDSDPSDDVPARLVLLAGGYGFYLDQDADTIRGLDPSCTDGRWVRQMPAADLGADSVVVLRKGVSERETLRPRISEILGSEEEAVREQQARWKKVLVARLASGGLHGIRKAVGRPDLTFQYARYWAGRNCISPRQPAFTRLLEHLEVVDAPDCLAAAKQLYSAHHKAGRQLAKELEHLVNEAVVQRLNIEDSVTLSVGIGRGSAQMTLFKVVAVSPEQTTVPAAALRTALKLKGTEWLG